MANVDTPFDFIDWFRQGGKWTTPDGRLTEEAINQLENIVDTSIQVINRTGGPVDIIQEITNSETFETSTSSAEYHELADDNEQIEDLIITQEPIDYEEPDYAPVIEWEVVDASSNETLTDHDFAEGTNGSTLKLDSKAGPGDQIQTCNGDGSTIRVNGDGIELRYAGKRGSCIDMELEGTSIHWYRFKNHWRGG